MKFVICLLAILCLIDLIAIFGGYFEFPYSLYWLASSDGFIPFFRDDLDIFDRKLESQRDFIFISIVFGMVWSVCSCSSAVYFRNRRYLASQWPLTLWKFTSIMLLMRSFYMIWAMYKFHFCFMKDFLIYIGEEESYSGGLGALYSNGTIGSIPAILIGSILFNLLISFISFLSIVTISDWRRLNIRKRIY